MACSMIRWAWGDVDVSDPFRLHHRLVMLSIQERLLLSRMSFHSAMHARQTTLPASSRSLLVT